MGQSCTKPRPVGTAVALVDLLAQHLSSVLPSAQVGVLSFEHDGVSMAYSTGLSDAMADALLEGETIRERFSEQLSIPDLSASRTWADFAELLDRIVDVDGILKWEGVASENRRNCRIRNSWIK